MSQSRGPGSLGSLLGSLLGNLLKQILIKNGITDEKELVVPYVGAMKCRSRLTRYRTKEILSDLSETIQVIAMTLVIYWEWGSFNKPL